MSETTASEHGQRSATIHTRRGMGAEDYCTCDGPWPCPKASAITRKRHRHLTTFDLFRLDLACQPLAQLAERPGAVYLVGSVERGEDGWRDVDVRMILNDDQFDRLFGHSSLLWEMFCFAWTGHLRAETALPIDFQVQRTTEANENHDGPRNPLGYARRRFCGLGDATRFEPNGDDRFPSANNGGSDA